MATKRCRPSMREVLPVSSLELSDNTQYEYFLFILESSLEFPARFTKMISSILLDSNRIDFKQRTHR